MGEKHSAVGYLFREGAFLPAQETKPVRNEFGLDLFQHRGSVYEGKTGLQFCSLQQAEDLAGFVEKHGGIEKVQKLIADSLERTGLSPRYTRPDEKKKDIFPPKEKDENRVFAKDLMGNKHYYYRFYNENGIELYTMEKKREFFQTVYIPCDGFMVGIDQRHRLEEVLKWLPTLEHGIRGEIERVFNQSIFRNRTIIGAVCILLAVLVCFGITPLFNAGLKAQTEAVRVKAEVIPRGTYITADMVEVYTRGASGMSDAIATSLDEVVGRYTDVELRKNTDVNTGWLSSEPLTQYEYLTKLDGSKVAISVTIPTFAKGGSGKVEAGDIIMLFATDKDTGETTQPPELKYVEVLAATQSSGADKEYQAPQDDEEENPEESLPSTITLLVNTEQAQLLAHLEESNSLHLAFVYRGTRENAEKFLAAQDQFFVEPEEDTAAQDGEQGEVSGDNNVADNTGDNAAGNEPAEEQEVENTDGE